MRKLHVARVTRWTGEALATHLRRGGNDAAQMETNPWEAPSRILSAKVDRDADGSWLIDVGNLVFGYGFRHTPDGHPWIAALLRGRGGGLPKLRHFYRVYAPANLDEAWAPVYGDESTAIAQTAIDVWPWRYPSTGSHAELLHTLVPNSRPGARTGRKGPLSREQVEFEWERLCAVNESIRTLGFQQRFFGGILGHLLHDGTSGAWVFVVEQGQHRAAVLAYRGWQRVPVRLAQARGAIIDVNDIADATSQNAAKRCLDPINVALRQRLVTATFSDS